MTKFLVLFKTKVCVKITKTQNANGICQLLLINLRESLLFKVEIHLTNLVVAMKIESKRAMLNFYLFVVNLCVCLFFSPNFKIF